MTTSEQFDEFAQRVAYGAAMVAEDLGIDAQQIQIQIGLRVPSDEEDDIDFISPSQEGAEAEEMAEAELISPTTLIETFDRQRSYLAIPDCWVGTRGAQQIEGVTFRDMRDCFVRASFERSGIDPLEQPTSIHDLPWCEMDVIAVFDRMAELVQEYGREVAG